MSQPASIFLGEPLSLLLNRDKQGASRYAQSLRKQEYEINRRAVFALLNT